MKKVTDWQLWAAFMAAPLIWSGLYLVFNPLITLRWSLDYPWLFLQLVLVIPILEELVFRGLVQEYIYQHTKIRWGLLSVANLITSLLFTVMHFLFHAPLWAVAVIFPSLVFGYFRERHVSLVTPIILHIFYNLGYFLLFSPV